MAKKEHDEFASNIDLIDVLPPGLYEAVMTPKDPAGASADLVGGDYLVRFETRTLDDIRALGGNDNEDDRKFAAVARVSEINLGLYRTFLQPWVQTWSNEGFANWMRRFHPLRLQYEMFSHANPFMRPLASFVEDVRANRQPVASSNVFWQAQEQLAEWIEQSLDAYRDVRDHVAEAWFHAIYGSPLVQAMAGLRASDASARRSPGKDPSHRAAVARRIEELRSDIPNGGPREAVLRALLYIRMPEGVVDERGFNLLRRARDEAGEGLTLSEFKQMVREQFLMLHLDERRAIEAIPSMLAKDRDLASRMAAKLDRMVEAVGLRSDLEKARWAEVQELMRSSRISMRLERRPISADDTSTATSSKH